MQVMKLGLEVQCSQYIEPLHHNADGDATLEDMDIFLGM